MDRTRHLIVGAGVTGLAYADKLGRDADYLVLEALGEIGGYCRTVKQDGFTWDFSGHFFHFKHPELEQELVSRMGEQRVKVVTKDARIFYDGHWVDFPFQKNIHQLPKEDFIDCLYDLFFKEDAEPNNFQDMLYAKFGRGIAEKFLIPYNEKLYATDLSNLDVDAMGRFFPYADLKDIIGNFRRPDNSSYNSTFTYPEGGAIQYVQAIASGVDSARISLGERLERVDIERRVATTNRREIAYENLVSSLPFDRLLRMANVPHDPSIYTYNKVLVFNLGFDRKGIRGPHWVYFPSREIFFYRVGFYDNIFDTDRMSIYVEIGYPADEQLGPEEVEAARQRVLQDLRKTGLIDDHQLVSYHTITLDPAYVHITQKSITAVEQTRAYLEGEGVYSAGRYGGWTYCAIEDNILEARALADRLGP